MADAVHWWGLGRNALSVRRERWISGLKRTPLKRGKPIARRSKKQAAFYRDERIPLVKLVLARAGNRCEIHWAGCTGYADTVHEILTRGRGGGIRAPGVNTPENCLAACKHCNEQVSLHPLEAERLGFLRHA